MSGVVGAESRRYVPLGTVAVAVFALDQATKSWVTQYVNSHGGEPIKVLGGKVLIDLTHNTGAAFGILAGGSVLFVAIAVAVVAAIVLSYHRVAEGPVILRVALGLILGGALGNLLDRIRLGYVVDFVDLRWWPVFNLADSCIVIGAVLLVLALSMRTGTT